LYYRRLVLSGVKEVNRNCVHNQRAGLRNILVSQIGFCEVCPQHGYIYVEKHIAG
jgi:hypothetical protein